MRTPHSNKGMCPGCYSRGNFLAKVFQLDLLEYTHLTNVCVVCGMKGVRCVSSRMLDQPVKIVISTESNRRAKAVPTVMSHIEDVR
jgi:hypothetical protein